ncbi:terminase large subunit [Dialister invisus]|uniref:terminase large subunit n=1 Tax=Dialister invisus TaxID=218538 RepID=UPI0023F83126|nr:terminase TerL endonuclease subunit [Dialister invisus]
MYSADRANYTISFIQCLKLGDDFYGQPFTLLDWQNNVVSQFYGTVKENGLRKYQYLYLEIPKKNGKSQIAAALGLYHTFADGVRDGEVYCVAADRGNAGIVFNAALSMLEQCPALMKRAKIKASTKEIVDTVSHTVLKVLSSEAYSKHGYKPSCVIFDELHAQPNRELWDIMTFGSGSARKEPVFIVLTTAGDDPDHKSIGWEIHEKARHIIEYRKGNRDGNYDNPVWLPFIYGLKNPDADIYKEELWYECNPSLGHTIQIETLRNEAIDAQQSMASERLFRWLRLNQWISVKARGWLPLTLFDQTVETIDEKILIGKKCFGGLDLSSTTDLTALVLLFPPQEGLSKWYAKFFAWIPEEKMREREKRDHVPFSEWMQQGYMESTPGDCVDYDILRQRIEDLNKIYKLNLGCDPYMSRMLTQLLKIDVSEIPQDIRNMSPAIKEAERMLYRDLMVHEYNPAARWCFGNAICYVDANENKKLVKDRSIDRIDITVAWVIAIAVSMTEPVVNLSAAIMSGEWSM